MRTLVATAAIGFLLVGCRSMSSDYVPMKPAPRPMAPRAGEQVEVFMADAPTRPFVEVGMVEVQEERGDYSSGELIAALRSRAGEAGCDGLILLGDNDEVVGSSSTSVDTSVTPT